MSKPGDGGRAVSPDSDFPVAVLNDVTVLARRQTRLEVCVVEGAHGKEAHVASAEPEVVGLGLPVLNRFPAALVGELCQNRLGFLIVVDLDHKTIKIILYICFCTCTRFPTVFHLCSQTQPFPQSPVPPLG